MGSRAGAGSIRCGLPLIWIKSMIFAAHIIELTARIEASDEQERSA